MQQTFPRYAVAMNPKPEFSQEQRGWARKLIEAGKFAEAIQLYRQAFPLENRPYMHETDEGDLRECLETPLPVFSFLPEDVLREIRLRAATCYLTGSKFTLDCDPWFPWNYSMSAEATVQNWWASIANYRNLVSWIQGGVVLRARIKNSCDGGCSACLAAAAQDYSLAELPSLPNLTCENLNTIGCRCIAIASAIKGIGYL
jgi:hypothetical protein